MQTRPPGSMPPGRRTPYETKQPREIARRVQGIISAGHVGKKDKEKERPLRFGPFPRKWFFTRWNKEVQVWRGKNGRFVKRPSAASP